MDDNFAFATVLKYYFLRRRRRRETVVWRVRIHGERRGA